MPHVDRIERQAQTSQHVNKQNDRRADALRYRRDRHTQNHQRFGADDSQQPSAMNDVGPLAGIEKGEDREADINEARRVTSQRYNAVVVRPRT